MSRALSLPKAIRRITNPLSGGTKLALAALAIGGGVLAYREHEKKKTKKAKDQLATEGVGPDGLPPGGLPPGPVEPPVPPGTEPDEETPPPVPPPSPPGFLGPQDFAPQPPGPKPPVFEGGGLLAVPPDPFTPPDFDIAAAGCGESRVDVGSYQTGFIPFYDREYNEVLVAAPDATRCKFELQLELCIQPLNGTYGVLGTVYRLAPGQHPNPIPLTDGIGYPDGRTQFNLPPVWKSLSKVTFQTGSAGSIHFLGQSMTPIQGGELCPGLQRIWPEPRASNHFTIDWEGTSNKWNPTPSIQFVRKGTKLYAKIGLSGLAKFDEDPGGFGEYDQDFTHSDEVWPDLNYKTKFEVQLRAALRPIGKV